MSIVVLILLADVDNLHKSLPSASLTQPYLGPTGEFAVAHPQINVLFIFPFVNILTILLVNYSFVDSSIPDQQVSSDSKQDGSISRYIKITERNTTEKYFLGLKFHVSIHL